VLAINGHYDKLMKKPRELSSGAEVPTVNPSQERRRKEWKGICILNSSIN
jgi:hypothetical protein